MRAPHPLGRWVGFAIFSTALLYRRNTDHLGTISTYRTGRNILGDRQVKCSQRRDCFLLPFGQARGIRIPRLRSRTTTILVNTGAHNTFSRTPLIPHIFDAVLEALRTHTHSNTNITDLIHDLGEIATRFWDLGYTKWVTDGKRY